MPVSFDDVLLMNSQDHLQTRGQEFSVITVPQRVDGSIQLETTSLEAALQRELDDGAMQAPIRDVEEVGGEDVVVDDQRPAELCCFKI